jgi:hypothetical protein
MVTGVFALMFGVDPKQVHAWYLAVYVDAVEWVELPNTLGMSQYADGGLLATNDATVNAGMIAGGRTANFRVAFPGVPDFTAAKFDAQGRGFKTNPEGTSGEGGEVPGSAGASQEPPPDEAPAEEPPPSA